MRIFISLGMALLVFPALAQATTDRAATKAIAKVTTQTYEISASGLNGIRQAMREAVLPIGLNRKAVASTNITMTPNVAFDDTDEACGISGVTVDVNATVTLPRWREYRYGTAAEKLAWNKYVGALKAHEDLHVAIGEEFGGNLQEVIEALPSRATCDELQKHIDRETNNLLERHRTAQNALDARTAAAHRR